MASKPVNSVFSGALITVAMRWCDRLIGFVSTLVLARLLAPDDFGIIAMASLVIGLADILLDLGVSVALIQNRNATQAHYDTAWTLRIAQTVFAAGVVAVAAPFAAEYFHDPRVEPVLYFMGIGMVLGGIENIGIVSFQKEMRFKSDFTFMFSRRLFGFVATVVSAWILQSYWALVIGLLAGRLFGVVMSYVMHPMRPRLSFECFGEIFAVSQWMLVRSIGLYLNNNLHRLVIGNRADTATMGAYTLANEISAMPATEVLTPLNRALFPAFVKAKADLGELKRLFLLAQGVQTLLAIPASVGLALVAKEAVLVLLGEKWISAVEFIQILALASVFQAITTSGGYVMITLGRVRNTAILVWAQVVLFGLLVLLQGDAIAALDIALLRLATMLGGLGLSLWFLMRTLHNLRMVEVGRTIFRPLLASASMAFVVLYALDFSGLPVLVLLLVKTTIGALTYALAVLVLWWLAGKPEGAESYLLARFGGLRKRPRP